MKLKEYLEILNRKVTLNPDLLEYEVIYASDDEGNSYDSVKYTPTEGRLEEGEFNSDSENHNAICLN